MVNTNNKPAVKYITYTTISSGDITIYETDLSRLDDGEYLNDTLIDVKNQIIINTFPDIKEKVYAFSCLVYPEMVVRNMKTNTSKTVDYVSSCLKNCDIFQYDYIFFPINKNLHWSLCVLVRPKLFKFNDASGNKPCFLHLDPLNMHDSLSIFTTIFNTLSSYYTELKNTRRHFNFVKCTAPKQTNGYDCGVYVIKYVEMILRLYPDSKQETIDSKFSKLFRLAFNSADVTEERLKYKEELCQIKRQQTNSSKTIIII
jgi:Ulp1 family protease